MANRKCICCGKEYKYCPNCRGDIGKPDWMAIFCGQECHDIFDVIVKHDSKKLTKEQAKSMLAKYDLSNLDTYGDTNRKCIEEILKEDEVKKEIVINDYIPKKPKYEARKKYIEE